MAGFWTGGWKDWPNRGTPITAAALEHTDTRLTALEAAPNVSPWTTGDTKVSAQAATHADPTGGTWYLADGSAIPGAETALIAMLGPNFPDARGRGLVMVGTHVDVNTIGDSDPIALASRRPKHGHTRTGAASMTGAQSTLALTGANSSLALTGSNSTIGLSGSNSSIGLGGSNSSITGGSAPSGASLLAVFNTTGAGTAWSGGSNQGMVGGSNSSLALTGSNSSLAISGSQSTIGMSGSNSSLALTGANSTLGVSDTIVIGPDTNDQAAYVVAGRLFYHS